MVDERESERTELDDKQRQNQIRAYAKNIFDMETEINEKKRLLYKEAKVCKISRAIIRAEVNRLEAIAKVAAEASKKEREIEKEKQELEEAKILAEKGN